ncbi:MAG: DNA polymerase III subunit epsilon [Bacteroidetes bacterium]|nr:MAG: DNA polymerase III subunit epsilon [Bacteroidota bacterium]
MRKGRKSLQRNTCLKSQVSSLISETSYPEIRLRYTVSTLVLGTFASRTCITMTRLRLFRPLAFIDLETTGTNVASDRIVEISVIRLFPDGREDQKTWRVNPTIPIPAAVVAIHNITDEDVKNEPTFKDLSKELFNYLQNCDLAGYNSNKFDIPLLAEEFLRAEVEFDVSNRRLLDVQNIFHRMEQRTLAAAYKFYCNKEMTNAHNAAYDIRATLEVLEAQLDRYGEQLQDDVEFLSEFSSRGNPADLAGRIVFNEKGEEVFSFGKHSGKTVEDVFRKEPSYYNWMMDGDFPRYTKKVITKIRLRMMNQK